jgi:hypothetical protein
MEKVLDNEFATLYVYPEKKVVHHVIKKFIFGDAFRTLMTRGADVFEEYNCSKWLSDDRKNSALKQEDVEWGQINWENRILAKGWKYWALVMPEKAIGQMNMRRLVDRYAGMGVTVSVFSDPDKAMAWLNSR